MLAGSGRPGGDPRAGALGLVEDAVLEPGVVAVEHAAGEPPVGVVGVGPQPVEQLSDPQPGLRAERVGELVAPRRPASGRRRGSSRPASRRRPWRTARRRCRRCGRGSPACTRASPASGTCRRTSAGPACATTARRTAGAGRAVRTRRTTRGRCPCRRRAAAATWRRSRWPSPRPSPCAAASASATARSPAADRWASTASRAISRCMISVEPSKIRLIRRSRSICSAGTARSPRAASESAVS